VRAAARESVGTRMQIARVLVGARRGFQITLAAVF
jgi:hypothetical protein